MKKRSEATDKNHHTLRQLQNRTRRLTLIILTLLFTAAYVSVSRADSSIDPISQVYFISEFDQVGVTQLKRTYSSGSIFRGHFGAGWCSELDARVLIYAAGETRFRSCDLDSAAALDARKSIENIQRTGSGFRRIREDGATQIFSSDGYLQRLIRTGDDIRILRDERQRPRDLLVRSFEAGAFRDARYPIILGDDVVSTNASTEASLVLIRGIGATVRFQYSASMMLVKTETSRFSYDDCLNMTVRLTGALRETIEYDPGEDRVIRIARSAAFGRDRLLLAITRLGKSNEAEIEMKIEVERGAETHPVRILYNRETRRVSLEGDRDIARMILNWIRA